MVHNHEVEGKYFNIYFNIYFLQFEMWKYRVYCHLVPLVSVGPKKNPVGTVRL